jgi:CII-binding regulator of phage lambda lysogenization HflD
MLDNSKQDFLELSEALIIKLQSRKDIYESAFQDVESVKKDFTHYNDEAEAIDEIMLSLKKDIVEMQTQIYILCRFRHKIQQSLKLFKIRRFSPCE